MKLELCMQDWEQAEDTANRILAVEPKNVEATRFKIMQLVCRKARNCSHSVSVRMWEEAKVFGIETRTYKVCRYLTNYLLLTRF